MKPPIKINITEKEIIPQLVLVKSTSTLHPLVKALIKHYHPARNSVGIGGVLYDFALVDATSSSVMAIAVLSKPLGNVIEKAKREIPEFKNIKREEVIFVRRIFSVPPFNASARLLIELERPMREQGYKALTSFVYPNFEGKLYQLAKWKKGWTRRGYTFVYKIIG